MRIWKAILVTGPGPLGYLRECGSLGYERLTWDLPGYAYMAGISAFWIAIGLILGTWANWVVTARRLRVFTQVCE